MVRSHSCVYVTTQVKIPPTRQEEVVLTSRSVGQEEHCFLAVDMDCDVAHGFNRKIEHFLHLNRTERDTNHSCYNAICCSSKKKWTQTALILQSLTRENKYCTVVNAFALSYCRMCVENFKPLKNTPLVLFMKPSLVAP